MSIKAIVTEDIQAYSLISLRGARDDDPDNIYLQATLKDYEPDLYATKDLKAGEEVSISIKGDHVWKVRLSKDTRPGTLISADDNGEASGSNTREHKNYIGNTLEGGKVEKVVQYIRKAGKLTQTLVGDIEELLNDEEI